MNGSVVAVVWYEEERVRLVARYVLRHELMGEVFHAKLRVRHARHTYQQQLGPHQDLSHAASSWGVVYLENPEHQHQNRSNLSKLLLSRQSEHNIHLVGQTVISKIIIIIIVSFFQAILKSKQGSSRLVKKQSTIQYGYRK